MAARRALCACLVPELIRVSCRTQQLAIWLVRAGEGGEHLRGGDLEVKAATRLLIDSTE